MATIDSTPWKAQRPTASPDLLPKTPEELPRLTDLLDLDEIQRVQDAFSAATGVAAIITEPDGTPITRPSGFCSFCIDVVRKTEKGLRNCMHSDSIIGKPKSDGPRVQRCLSGGLMDGGAGIMVGRRHIANWLIGQVLDHDYDIQEMLAYADTIGADRKRFSEALTVVRRMSGEQFRNVCNFLFLNARQISKLAFENLAQAREIRRRKLAETSLSREKELFRVTLHSIGDAVITTDIRSRITGLNPAAADLTGWKQDDAVGCVLGTVFPIPCDGAAVFPAGSLCEGGCAPGKFDGSFLSKNGTERYVSGSTTPIEDGDGTIHGLVLVFRDVTDEKKHRQEIEHLSFHDNLTGLYNRAFFESEVERLDRNGIHPVSAIIGDVNGLKITNDVFGHGEGDRLLRTMAEILRKSCRPTDIIARWGGDEFAIILPGTDHQCAAEICAAVRSACLECSGYPIVPSIALGIATRETGEKSLRDVLKKAEDHMYRNKLLECRSKFSGAVVSLERTLFEKSFETEEHALRLVDLSRKIGLALGLSESELDDLQLLAKLHDIGKVAIPDHILTKPGRLTDEEWEEMKKHSEIGFRIAQSSLELSHIADYILCHHERWDGMGYPRGLREDSIPLLSRIICVADAFDVMTNIRPYKEKMERSEALCEVRRCAGLQFDPAIARVLCSLYDE